MCTIWWKTFRSFNSLYITVYLYTCVYYIPYLYVYMYIDNYLVTLSRKRWNRKKIWKLSRVVYQRISEQSLFLCKQIKNSNVHSNVEKLLSPCRRVCRWLRENSLNFKHLWTKSDNFATSAYIKYVPKVQNIRSCISNIVVRHFSFVFVLIICFIHLHAFNYYMAAHILALVLLVNSYWAEVNIYIYIYWEMEKNI